ncbi:hypothetical protein CUJ83_05535 [Methanocella sp. CWC-04]|uniref:DUF2085 domain-containing protein n=1 Tax=Methanooceanicella nereidis TaxID=2052831 RepID=A0AAP2W6U0_9EURY|nr:DUF2085 domain-containing protein [Methanocella sp. CWC-04]MCD1294461.1 hypothetical protein [Methanocella sp. CWC-04]
MIDLKMLIYDIILASYIIISVLIFVPPVLLSITSSDPGYLSLSDSIHTFFSPLCHQLPWRSIFLNDIKMPVCARCTSIYIATALGLLFFRLKGFGTKEFKMNWILFGLLFVPTGIDGVTQLFGLRESTNELRIIAGFPYGLGYALLMVWALPFIWALLELIWDIVSRKDDKTVNGVVKRLKDMVWPIK